jgi:DNA repair protein RecN (Recombination protein N)
VAAALTDARRKGAKRLAKKVESELEHLAMDGASLEITVEPHPDGFTSTGADRVEFMVATNAGMPASPLRDAASGGELSRVMLALTGLAAGAGSPTLAFDEIDAGVGGKTARAVGARLKRLGSETQVVCITHLPQVASQASAHFRITKSSKAGETRADVERVDGEELVAEIVRMLGSERDDEAADRHARELLAAA